jgi:hypothetical protein
MTSVRDAAGSRCQWHARPRPPTGERGTDALEYAETPRGIITELRKALDAIPADEPRNYL